MDCTAKEFGINVSLAFVEQCLEYARQIGATNIADKFNSLNPTATLVLETLRIERGAADFSARRVTKNTVPHGTFQP